MKKGKSILIIVLAVFVILAITSFINTDLAANLTLIAFLCLMVYIIYFLIKKLFKNINKIKDLDKQLHNQKATFSSNNIQTNKTELENDVKVEDIIDIPKLPRKPLFRYSDLQVYKNFSIEEIEEEINNTMILLQENESELELSPNDENLVKNKLELIDKYQHLDMLKNKKIKAEQQEPEEETPIKIKHEIEQQKKQRKINAKYLPVVGTNYTDAYYILSNTIRDNGGIWNVGGYQYHNLILTLQAEPDNPYDPNAILVTYESPKDAKVDRSGKIGHLPKDAAKHININQKIQVKAEIEEGYGDMTVRIPVNSIEKYIK
ncbi:HIRAN domain-containing protein [Anaerofustis butyriciformans]|uniref:HIRAN domain-containing protein n=1 Tax=Anaerofustis butyriciformans TaxID=3108533 RepID=UPI002E2EDFFC|nr:HIRAN domain-containing protein [Anaerofustis sp. HA2171]